ncbi:hypothetical protein ACJW31_10G005200 [Castanea mollissima]
MAGALISVAEGIIGQLAKPALQEIVLLWGVKGELDELRNTVSSIKAVILDAEEKQAQDGAISDWLRKLTDVLYEADDLLDDFSTEVLQREAMTRNKKAKENKLKRMRNMNLRLGASPKFLGVAVVQQVNSSVVNNYNYLEVRIIHC